MKTTDFTGGTHPLMKLTSDQSPPKDKIIRIWKDIHGGEQVEYKDGYFYKWEYGITDKKVCSYEEVVAWRGCTGFDF